MTKERNRYFHRYTLGRMAEHPKFKSSEGTPQIEVSRRFLPSFCVTLYQFQILLGKAICTETGSVVDSPVRWKFIWGLRLHYKIIAGAPL